MRWPGRPLASRSSIWRRCSARCSSIITSEAGIATRRRALHAALVGASLPALTALVGCDLKPAHQFRHTNITGAEFARDFALTDHHGKPRTLADFRGKVVQVFFGYTQCPDVCPTTMLESAEAMKKLGALADQVQVLFVSVDPERDTPAVLAQYVPAFDPRFLGLYGDAETTARVAKEFKIFYQKVAGASPSAYTIDHTAGSYVFDKTGKVRLYVKHAQGVDALAEDLKTLIELSPNPS